MPKRSKHRDSVERARRKVVDAQLQLHIAQEERSLAIARGEREVMEARERAARRVARATKRVEQRAGEVARAEARLHVVSRPGDGVSTPQISLSPSSTPLPRHRPPPGTAGHAGSGHTELPYGLLSESDPDAPTVENGQEPQ